MTPLPLLHPAGECGSCGACCEEIGTPPGFAAYFPVRGLPVAEDQKQYDDYGYLMSAPVEVRQALADYYAAVERGEVEDRSGYAVPCLWFDAEAKQCKHYDHRPQVCREFRVGSNACRNWRASVGRCDEPPPADEDDGD